MTAVIKTKQEEKLETEYGWKELEQDLGVKIKRQPPEINYQYVEHEDAEQKLNAAFDILFDELIKKKRG